jgi:hypothetical protein
MANVENNQNTGVMKPASVTVDPSYHYDADMPEDRERLIRFGLMTLLVVLALAMFTSIPQISRYAIIDKILWAMPWQWMVGIAGGVVLLCLVILHLRRR